MIITDAQTMLANWALWVYGTPANYRPSDGSHKGDRSGLSVEGQCWLRVVAQAGYKDVEQGLRARYGRFERVVCPRLDAWINTLAADLLRVPLSISTTDDLDDTLPPTKWRKGGRK